MASTSTVLTKGFGPWGSLTLVITSGFGASEQAADFGIGVVDAIQLYTPGRVEFCQLFVPGAEVVQRAK